MCDHLNASKSQKLLDSYQAIVRYSLLVKSKQNLKYHGLGNPEIVRSVDVDTKQPINSKPNAVKRSYVEGFENSVSKLPNPACSRCKSMAFASRLHACLQCVYIACFKEHLDQHILECSHSFAVDYDNLTIYCRDCKDYVYDDDLECILETERHQLNFIVSMVHDPFSESQYIPMIKISDAEKLLVLESAKKSRCAGVMGLQNMGSTCFMNAIIQTLLHNPFLTTYFLSELHTQGSCAIDSRICMACQLDALFQQSYTGDGSAFAPHKALYAMWIGAKHIAGYSQQDAHEYFISVLDQVHRNCQGIDQACECIIHQVFGGLLQSQVGCSKCHHQSMTDDPFLDISLEIKKLRGDSNHEHTLLECLNEYTTSEKVAYFCKKCGFKEEGTKQLSLKLLPPILSFQLKVIYINKRFEHSTSTTKINTKTPFTTNAVKQRINNLISSNFDPVLDSIPAYCYSLYAIVCHQGSVDTGHYKTYCKTKNEWFLFDDARVTVTTLEEVLRCDGYMCFYIQNL